MHTASTTTRIPTRRFPRTRGGVLLATVGTAVTINVGVYLIGLALGGTYRFTSQGQPATVDLLTLIGFTAVPIGVGMTIAALLPVGWRWVTPTALIVTVVAGLGSIVAMPLQTDLDAASKVALSLCHVAVTAVTCAGLMRLRAVRLSATRGEVATRS